jgi:tetratricopeptide (TPR) repeat protein
VLRFALFILLFGSIAGFSQNPAQDSQNQPPTAAPAANSTSRPIPEQVAGAEAAIVKSDWKTAQAELDLWLAAHPDDARALFDAGYVADAQNRLDDAASLYRRAVEANPNSFEAHLSLGLLLARQGKLDEARSELVTATGLDPGDAGPSTKARAWRALAEIDRSNDTTEASNDLLEALKLSPETSADTLLAASLADEAGQYEAAETAYRRILAKDPKSAPANAGLAH